MVRRGRWSVSVGVTFSYQTELGFDGREAAGCVTSNPSAAERPYWILIKREYE
jgi:hypothetical protein